jgi:hypothetical protein
MYYTQNYKQPNKTHKMIEVNLLNTNLRKLMGKLDTLIEQNQELIDLHKQKVENSTPLKDIAQPVQEKIKDE